MASTQNSLKQEDVFVKEYNSNSNLANTINSQLQTDFVSAVKATRTLPTKLWQDLKSESKELCGDTGKITGEPSKSDFVLTSTTGVKFGMSYKNGPGRPTSSRFSETRALFLSVLYGNPKHNRNVSLKQEVHSFFNKWQPLGAPIDTPYGITTTAVNQGYASHEILESYIELSRTLNKEVKLLVEQEEDFMIDVIHEALTGEHKFGKGLQTANFLLESEKNDVYGMKFISSTESSAFRDYCKKQLKKVNVAMKSAGGVGDSRKHWIRFM